jgi:hypothetical protein
MLESFPAFPNGFKNIVFCDREIGAPHIKGRCFDWSLWADDEDTPLSASELDLPFGEGSLQ